MDSHADPRFDSRGAGITVRRALELPGLRSGLPEILAGSLPVVSSRWFGVGVRTEACKRLSRMRGGRRALEMTRPIIAWLRARLTSC